MNDMNLCNTVRQTAYDIHVYHGQNRGDIDTLRDCDVVITTFQTLSSAWKRQKLNKEQDPMEAQALARVLANACSRT